MVRVGKDTNASQTLPKRSSANEGETTRADIMAAVPGIAIMSPATAVRPWRGRSPRFWVRNQVAFGYFGARASEEV